MCRKGGHKPQGHQEKLRNACMHTLNRSALMQHDTSIACSYVSIVCPRCSFGSQGENLRERYPGSSSIEKLYPT